MSIEPVSFDQLKFTQADRMRKSLHVADISVQEMAEYLDVSRNTVSRWINDEREPKRSFLRLWALRTGVPLEWLETGELKEETPSPDGDGESSPLPDLNRRPALYNVHHLPLTLAA